MLVDIRNRKSSSPVKIPPKYQAFIYRWFDLGDASYKVVIAESQMHADAYINDWCFREGIDTSLPFYCIAIVDYEVVGKAGDEYFENLLFPCV